MRNQRITNRLLDSAIIVGMVLLIFLGFRVCSAMGISRQSGYLRENSNSESIAHHSQEAIQPESDPIPATSNPADRRPKTSGPKTAKKSPRDQKQTRSRSRANRSTGPRSRTNHRRPRSQPPRRTRQPRSYSTDHTAPSVRYQLSGSKYTRNRYVSARARLALRAQDDSSGVARIYWRGSSSEGWRVYRRPIRLKQYTLAAGRLEFKAVDRAGNASRPRVFRFRIDNQAPMLPNIFASYRTFDKSDGARMVPPAIRVTAFEQGARLEYRFRGGVYRRVEARDLIRLPGEGLHYITLRIRDEAGNARSKTYKIKSDRSAPRTRVIIGK